MGGILSPFDLESIGGRGRSNVRRPYDRRVGATGEELRAAMRRLASGIAVLTVAEGDDELGVTVGSLVSLSLSPPLVSVSIGLQSPAHELLERCEGFTLSLLSGEQAGVAQHFARSGLPPLARWVGVETEPGRFGRRVSGSLAWLECETWSSLPVGDHTLFVGTVVELALADGERPSLVYLRTAYHSL
jgi:flavin reductase (DIM6/NTAB) family NADH-FMN oxidoreductase RutF